jgi:hypothetical protein
LSLKTFFTHKKSLHIGIRSDNTTAVAYVNQIGGMTSILLDNLSAEIWSWCSERDIFLTAQYIPGNETFNADHMSRYFTDLTELKSEIFHRICNHFFLPDIDLFASRLNYLNMCLGLLILMLYLLMHLLSHGQSLNLISFHHLDK